MPEQHLTLLILLIHLPTHPALQCSQTSSVRGVERTPPRQYCNQKTYQRRNPPVVMEVQVEQTLLSQQALHLRLISRLRRNPPVVMEVQVELTLLSQQAELTLLSQQALYRKLITRRRRHQV